jgi:hypothetical protein
MRNFDLVSRYKNQCELEISANAAGRCALIPVLLAAMKRCDWNAFCREFRLADCSAIGFHPVHRNLRSARVLLRGELGD